MASPAARRMGPLIGGLLASALAMFAWAARRQPSARTEPPAPANRPSVPSKPSGGRPQAQPPTHGRTLGRLDLWAFLAFSVAVAIGTVLVYIIVRPPSWVLLGAIASGTVLLAACVLVIPHLLAPSRTAEDLKDLDGGEELSAKDRIQFEDDRRALQNDVRTALLQAVVGAAVLIGVLFTWQQQQATSRQVADQLAVTRQGQVGERFSRAVSQLGSDSIDVRLGGLYELEQLAKQTPERRLVIIEVVAAFIREHARPPATTTGPRPNAPPSNDAPAPPQDVAAALTILERRSIHDGDPPADLRRVKLGGFNLAEVSLQDTTLAFADLHGAYLLRADFRGADLTVTNFRGADLTLATLAFAYLHRADLRGANLGNADLGDVKLPNADLRGADLSLANLRQADLRFANLSGADLFGADFRGADLGFANLRGARADGNTQWPTGFDWRGAGVNSSSAG